MNRPYVMLGTDGFGCSDTLRALRAYFEVDRAHITVAARKSLAEQEAIPPSTLGRAIAQLGIEPERVEPWLN